MSLTFPSWDKCSPAIHTKTICISKIYQQDENVCSKNETNLIKYQLCRGLICSYEIKHFKTTPIWMFRWRQLMFLDGASFKRMHFSIHPSPFKCGLWVYNDRKECMYIYFNRCIEIHLNIKGDLWIYLFYLQILLANQNYYWLVTLIQHNMRVLHKHCCHYVVLYRFTVISSFNVLHVIRFLQV